MNYRFLLAIIPLFLCLSSVLAIDITSCYNITSSGYYQFTGNITTTSQCGFGIACMQINASDVTLDMKGYSLINNASCSYGIIVLPKDIIDPSVTHSNINVLNGRIINFLSSGIELYGSTDGGSITYIDFLGNSIGVGNGVVLDTGYDTDLIIGLNYFSHGHTAIFGTCLTDCRIYDNEIRFFTVGFYLYGNGFDVQRNLIGFSTKNETSCYKEDWPMEYGLYCTNCNNSIIRNNDIMAQNTLYFDNYAHDNNITYNIFRTFYNYEPIISFDSTTSNNLFCSNLIISGVPTLVDYYGVQQCYFGTDVNNAKSSVIDSGSNTITEDCTSNCQAGWFCQDVNRIYINSTCGITESYICEYSCESGIYGAYCIGNQISNITITTTTILPPQVTNVSWYTPFVNQSDLNESGVTWITPFVTPFFFVLAVTIILCAVLTGVTKSPIVFPLSLLGFTLIYWYYQMLPNIIAIFIVLLEVIGSATLFKNQLAK